MFEIVTEKFKKKKKRFSKKRWVGRFYHYESYYTVIKLECLNSLFVFKNKKIFPILCLIQGLQCPLKDFSIQELQCALKNLNICGQATVCFEQIE